MHRIHVRARLNVITGENRPCINGGIEGEHACMYGDKYSISFVRELKAKNSLLKYTFL